MTKFGIFTAVGAALLLTAGLRADEPASGGSGNARFQRDRSRGFGGFADWDSRRGGYDRSRRQDSKDQDKQAGDDKRDGRGGRRGPPGRGPAAEPRGKPPIPPRGELPLPPPGSGGKGGPPQGGSHLEFGRGSRSRSEAAPARGPRGPRPGDSAQGNERRGPAGPPRGGFSGRGSSRSGDWRSQTHDANRPSASREAKAGGVRHARRALLRAEAIGAPTAGTAITGTRLVAVGIRGLP